MDSNLTWLKAEFIDKDFSNYNESVEIKSELDSKLLELLSETQWVTNKNTLEIDMEERFSHSDFRLANGIYLPHCKTRGVSDLCFSAILDKTNSVYGMIAIPDYTNSMLKPLASIVELLTEENLIKVVKARKETGSNDLTKIFNALL